MTYIQAMQIALERATTQEEIDFLEYQIEAEKMHVRMLEEQQEESGFNAFQDLLELHRRER